MFWVRVAPITLLLRFYLPLIIHKKKNQFKIVMSNLMEKKKKKPIQTPTTNSLIRITSSSSCCVINIKGRSKFCVSFKPLSKSRSGLTLGLSADMWLHPCWLRRSHEFLHFAFNDSIISMCVMNK